MTPPCATPVAVVGIGNMGLAMALRLRDAGQEVRVHDIDPARHALAATAGAVSGAPVAPSLVTAGPDSRFLTPVAKDVYRFQPVEFSLKDVQMIHGTNEHMTLKNLEKMVDFYGRLIVTATQ